MSDPFRLRVLKAITAAIERITPENGFQHDLRGAVFRGRSIYGESDPLPMISILEPPIPKDVVQARNNTVESTGHWELLIQGFVKDDYNNPSDPAHHLMAEVKAIIVAEKRRDRGRNAFGMGGRIDAVHIGQGSVRPPDDVSDKAFFWLTLTLNLVENLELPYD